MTELKHSEPTPYDTAKRYFTAAMEHMLAAGRSVGEFSEFAMERFGENTRPHLNRFMVEVREGSVKVKGLTRSALAAMAGQHVSPAQREAMIREAAYYHAERRSFQGGSNEEDWRAAEQEINARLAAEAGLVEKGRRWLATAAGAAELELGNVKQAVSQWIEARRANTGAGDAPAAAAAGGATEKPAQPAEPAPPAKRAAKSAKPSEPTAKPTAKPRKPATRKPVKH